MTKRINFEYSFFGILILTFVAQTVFAQNVVVKTSVPQTLSTPVVFENKDQAVKMLNHISQAAPNALNNQKFDEVAQNLINNGDIIDQSTPEQQVEIPARFAIIQYTTVQDDTLESVAVKFDLTEDTIKLANQLADSNIQPELNLTILPADGILYTVKKGDTISAIVDYYNGDLQKTFEKNSLINDLIFSGQQIAVIGGVVQPEKQVVVANAAKKKVKTTSAARATNVVYSRNVVKLYQDYTNNCYAWVVKQGYHPVGRGNARNIVTNSSQPTVGGLVVTYESAAGHVAIVVGVGNGTFTLRESNYIKGWITERTLPISYAKLKGFVN